MKIHLHKNARTTPAQRAFIQDNPGMNTSLLAMKLGISETTVRRWKSRTFIYDKPHTPKTISRALTTLQQIMVVLIRISMRPGLDDLTAITSEFITPDCSRSGLNRYLQKYGISRQPTLNRESPYDLSDHRGTYFYFSKIVLPVLPDMRGTFSIHTLLDVRFKWVHLQVCSLPETPPLSFIQNAIQQYPLNVLGIFYSDPVYVAGKEKAYPEACRHLDNQIRYYSMANSLKHHRIRIPERPQAALEKACHSLKKQPLEISACEAALLNADLARKIRTYNMEMPLRNLKQKSPLQALKNFHTHFPGSFQYRPGQPGRRKTPDFSRHSRPAAKCE